MNKEEALSLLAEYQEVVVKRGTGPNLLIDTSDRWPGGDEAKAMRWLGFAQGMLVARGIYNLDEVKQHSRDKALEPGVLWLARWKDGDYSISAHPLHRTHHGWRGLSYDLIDGDMRCVMGLPDLKWEDEPIRIKLDIACL